MTLSSRLGKRNIEKDTERLLVQTVAAPSLSSVEFVYRLAANTAVSATTITLNRAVPGPGANELFVVIDPFTTECEVRKATSISGATYTVAALAFAHAADDLVIWTTSPAVNVKWFGAKGDNSTVDTVAIRRACYAASYFGGVVWFPAGRYKTDTIYLSTDGDASYPKQGRIALIGEQTAIMNGVTDTIGTQLIHIDGSSNPLIEIDGTSVIARAVRIENMLMLSGNNTTNMIKTWKCSEHTEFRNLWIKVENSSCNGIYLDSSWHVTFDHVSVRGDASGSGTWTGTGIKIESPVTGITSNLIVMLNCITDYMGTGIQIGHRSTQSPALKGPIAIIGGQTANNDQEGMYVGSGTRHLSISSMNIEWNYDQGILIDNYARGVSIRDCFFYRNGEGSSVYEVQIGGSIEQARRIYMRQCEFNECTLGIDIRTSAAQQYIDIDHITFNPKTPSSGTGILVEATTQLDSVITLGPNLHFIADFSTNISDANNNLARPIISNRFVILSGGETTYDVSDPLPLRHIRFTNGSSTTVTDFTNGYFGQMLILHFGNTNTTIEHGTPIKLSGGVDFTPASSSILLTLVRSSSDWIEQSRT